MRVALQGVVVRRGCRPARDTGSTRCRTGKHRRKAVVARCRCAILALFLFSALSAALIAAPPSEAATRAELRARLDRAVTRLASLRAQLAAARAALRSATAVLASATDPAASTLSLVTVSVTTASPTAGDGSAGSSTSAGTTSSDPVPTDSAPSGSVPTDPSSDPSSGETAVGGDAAAADPAATSGSEASAAAVSTADVMAAATARATAARTQIRRLSRLIRQQKERVRKARWLVNHPMQRVRGSWRYVIKTAAKRYRISAAGLYRLMMLESSGRAHARGCGGLYLGLFQYCRSTWYGAWNPYRRFGIYNGGAQIWATAYAIRSGWARRMWPNTYWRAF